MLRSCIFWWAEDTVFQIFLAKVDTIALEDICDSAKNIWNTVSSAFRLVRACPNFISAWLSWHLITLQESTFQSCIFWWQKQRRNTICMQSIVWWLCQITSWSQIQLLVILRGPWWTHFVQNFWMLTCLDVFFTSSRHLGGRWYPSTLKVTELSVWCRKIGLIF